MCACSHTNIDAPKFVSSLLNLFVRMCACSQIKLICSYDCSKPNCGILEFCAHVRMFTHQNWCPKICQLSIEPVCAHVRMFADQINLQLWLKLANCEILEFCAHVHTPILMPQDVSALYWANLCARAHIRRSNWFAVMIEVSQIVKS